MTMLFEYLLFFSKVATFVVAILLLGAGMFALRRRYKADEHLQIASLNEHYDKLSDEMHRSIFPKKAYRLFRKDEKKRLAERKKDPHTHTRAFL